MYKIKFNPFLKCLVFVSILITNSCSHSVVVPEQDPVVDRSFVTGEICDPPCWYGLKINESTKDDVVSTLNQLPFIEPGSYKEGETYWLDGTLTTDIRYRCVKSNSDPCGILTFYKGILWKNWIAVNYDLTLEEAIERLGTPDRLTYLWPSPSGVCDVSVLWVEKGITIGFDDRKKHNECENIIDGNKLSSNILVEDISYTTQDDLEYTLALPGGCCELKKWPGLKDK